MGVKIMVEHFPRITSAEISMLWSTYISDTMSICVLKHFLHTCEDEDVIPIIELALGYSNDHVEQIANLFAKEGIPQPEGFGDQDVHLEAKKLFSDVTYMRYLHHMARTGLNSYSLAKSISARKDIRLLFKHFLSQTEDLYDQNTNLMEVKGVFIRSPYMAYPERVEYVTDRDFLGGLIGHRRPLLGIEIAHLGINIEVANVAKTLLLGFSQVAQSKKISDYLKGGYDLGNKIVEEFILKLKENDSSYPSTWDSTITSSIDAPFSDKLMLFHSNAQSAIGLGDFGLAIAASLRKDLTVNYEACILRVGKFAQEGARLLIEHGWFEKPPQTLDRESIRTQK
jgi:hypothetical protein